MHRNKKKGITLTEICVALAVLSIVSLVVVSFAAMATGRGATGTDKLKFMQDIELLETVVDDWFEAVYTGAGSMTESAEPMAKRELKTTSGLTLQWNNGNLIAVFPAEGGESVSRTFQFEVITDVQFEVKENPSKTDEIFFCTVTYVYRQGQNKEVEKNYTFCINPRVGESVS